VLVPANFNCPGQIVISGERAACERAISLAEEFGCRALPLKVAGAFHSPLMAPAAEGLANALAQTHLAVPRLMVPTNVDGEYHVAPERVRESLRQQLVQPVRWQKSVERLAADGFDTFVEVGPGRVLTGLLRKINRQLRVVNVSAVADLDALSTASPASV
jgi:[acyl-carrier-protein] S-malonyltransferase